MRLTDMDVLLTQMKKYHKIRDEEANMTGDRAACATWDDAVILVKNAPTVDAEPVKHGKWIKEPNCYYRCFECGAHYPSIKGYMDYQYCPYCGAKNAKLIF